MPGREVRAMPASAAERLHIGLSPAPTWLRDSAWRRPDSAAEHMLSAGFAARVATLAERACLDLLFTPDAAFLDRSVLTTAPGFTTLDSMSLMTALSQHTTHIGLVPTAHSALSAPYQVARQVQSLQHLSEGRAGWNVVTALGGGANFGVQVAEDPEVRYGQATEFVEVVRALWRGYPAEAILVDRKGGRFADADLVRPADHRGEHFDVEGPLTLPMHAAGEPPMVHASASAAGQAFAAEHADAVFIAAREPGAAVQVRRGLAQRVASSGRDPGALRVLPGLSLFLAGTEDEARELYAEATRAGVRGAPHWTVVGTPAQAADEILRWADAGALDGFLAFPGGSWSSVHLLTEEVIPRLAAEGRFRSSYEATTLRGHLGL